MGSWAIDSLIIDSPLNISSLMPQDMSPGSQLPMYNDIHTEWTRQTQTNKPLQWDKISKLENTFGQRLWWRTVNTNISTGLGLDSVTYCGCSNTSKPLVGWSNA